MATFENSLTQNDTTFTDFISHLKGLSVHVFSPLVDEHQNSFSCIKCFQLPEEICFTTKKCNHCFCEKCVDGESYFLCPACHIEISQDDLIVDTKYWAFYECFKLRSLHTGSSGKALSIDYLNTVKRPQRFNYLLQEECRKIFNRNPFSPVKNGSGDLENVKLLLNYGANPNVLNKDGWTLMHEAVDYGHVDVLQVLLQGGGLVNAYSHDRVTTCLHDALDDDIVNVSVIRILLSYGADIEARDRSGTTAKRKAQMRDVDLITLSICDPKIQIPLKYKTEEPPLLYGCNLPVNKQKMLNDFCQKFKIKQCPRKKVSKEVTHIIVESDSCKPSFPVLFGILQGCYIIKVKWIDDSLKNGEILPLERYEVNGTKDYPNSGVPQQSRMNSELLQPKLFAGGQFNILDSIDHMISAEEKEQVVELISAGGGQLLTRTNSCQESIGKSFFYHAHGGPLHYCTVIVLHKTEPSKRGWETIGHFSLKWLHKAIQRFQIIP